jgi:ABC-type Fe3+/spermidine/putrescine transport system ATPase subunit
LLRPERIRLGAESGARARGIVVDRQYFGSFVRLRVQVEDATSLAVDLGAAAGAPPPTGARVNLHWDAAAIHLLADGAEGRA